MGTERRWAQKAEKHNGFYRFVRSRNTIEFTDMLDLGAGRGSKPTAVADPSWGGLGGVPLK